MKFIEVTPLNESLNTIFRLENILKSFFGMSLLKKLEITEEILEKRTKIIIKGDRTVVEKAAAAILLHGSDFKIDYQEK